jgi:DNA helicase-2/ATP-dependent DNA helicase PcrA
MRGINRFVEPYHLKRNFLHCLNGSRWSTYNIQCAVDGRIDPIRHLDTGETSIIDFKSSAGAQAEEITRDQLHFYAVGYQELDDERTDPLEVLNLGVQAKSTRKIVNGLLTNIRYKVRASDKVCAPTRPPRLAHWCGTCDNCDRSGVYRTHP